MIEWKDTSSWSRNEKDRSVPKEWTAQVGKFTLIIHHHIDYDPDKWLLTCRPFLFEAHELASTDIGLAKCQAVAKLQVVCREAIEVINDEPFVPKGSYLTTLTEQV